MRYEGSVVLQYSLAAISTDMNECEGRHFIRTYNCKSILLSSDEEGRLSITADERNHPESRSTSQTRRPQRRPQLWKRKPVKEEEGEGGGEGVGLEHEREESREYEDEDFGKTSLLDEVITITT